MENYLYSEDIDEEHKVKKDKTKLKEHALLWWNFVQEERERQGKSKITSWERMKKKLKGKFIPCDYNVQLLKKL